MAGVAITLDVAGQPQAGTQTIKCSSPTSLANFISASAVGPGSEFVQVTLVADINGNAPVELINLSRILSVVGT